MQILLFQVFCICAIYNTTSRNDHFSYSLWINRGKNTCNTFFMFYMYKFPWELLSWLARKRFIQNLCMYVIHVRLLKSIICRSEKNKNCFRAQSSFAWLWYMYNQWGNPSKWNWNFDTICNDDSPYLITAFLVKIFFYQKAEYVFKNVLIDT